MKQDDTLSFDTIADITRENRIPFQVTIELLNNCNFRCVHCYLPNHMSAGISYDKICDVFRQLRDLGTFRVNLTGGELFVRSDILEIVREARRLGFSVSLLSNASLITDEIAKQLSELHINTFSTTVFSLNKEINDKITSVDDSLEKVLSGVKSLLKFHVPVQIKTPLMEINKFAYRDLKPYCKEIGASYQASPIILPKSDGDMTPTQYRISESDLEIIMEELDESINLLNKKDEGLPCPSIRNTMSIDCYGDVFPCNSFYFKVGNIYERTIFDIWNFSEGYKVLNAIHNRDLPKCQKCDLKQFCERCPGKALLEDGDLCGCSSLDRCMAQVYAKLYNKRMKI